MKSVKIETPAIKQTEIEELKNSPLAKEYFIFESDKEVINELSKKNRYIHVIFNRNS